MKTIQEKIENIIDNYFEKQYDESDFPRVCEGTKITKILPIDNGYYVEGILLVELGIDNYDDGDFGATIDKKFNILDLNWGC